MEWNISRRSPYRDEECFAMDDWFSCFHHDCRFRADGRPTRFAAAIISVYLALAASSTAPELYLCSYCGRWILGRGQPRGCARTVQSMERDKKPPTFFRCPGQKPDQPLTGIGRRRYWGNGKIYPQSIGTWLLRGRFCYPPVSTGRNDHWLLTLFGTNR
jgi:hypothetical protein